MSITLKSIHVTSPEFEALPEYSCSVPTGVIVGKRWKAHAGDGCWLMGEYVAIGTETDGTKYAEILWRRLERLAEEVEPRPV